MAARAWEPYPSGRTCHRPGLAICRCASHPNSWDHL